MKVVKMIGNVLLALGVVVAVLLWLLAGFLFYLHIPDLAAMIESKL